MILTLTSQDAGATYPWFDCATGQIILGATLAAYTPAINSGSYAVIVSAIGCSDTSDCYALGATGIDNQGLNRQLKVYPNPAHTLVHIETHLLCA